MLSRSVTWDLNLYIGLGQYSLSAIYIYMLSVLASKLNMGLIWYVFRLWVWVYIA